MKLYDFSIKTISYVKSKSDKWSQLFENGEIQNLIKVAKYFKVHMQLGIQKNKHF